MTTQIRSITTFLLVFISFISAFSQDQNYDISITEKYVGSECLGFIDVDFYGSCQPFLLRIVSPKNDIELTIENIYAGTSISLPDPNNSTSYYSGTFPEGDDYVLEIHDAFGCTLERAFTVD